jgi:hypothetical protein
MVTKASVLIPKLKPVNNVIMRIYFSEAPAEGSSLRPSVWTRRGLIGSGADYFEVSGPKTFPAETQSYSEEDYKQKVAAYQSLLDEACKRLGVTSSL